MIKVENIDVYGLGSAITASRNPMLSWSKSDSRNYYNDELEPNGIAIGNADMDLLRRLYNAGVEHRTYARMIYVWMDITAPLYWWKEMDRYTVGKSQVSTSTMHKIHAKEFEPDDFSIEHLYGDVLALFEDNIIETLNIYRKAYINTKDKRYWWQMIQLLPSSYNQRRSICMSYEVVFKIIHERTGHKLTEWETLVDVLKNLPYVKEIMGVEN